MRVIVSLILLSVQNRPVFYHIWYNPFWKRKLLFQKVVRRSGMHLIKRRSFTHLTVTATFVQLMPSIYSCRFSML